MVLGVGLPVVHINLGQTGNQQFELLLSEDGNKIWWDDFMEAWMIISICISFV